MEKNTVLVIDDNAENLRVLKNVLDGPDCDVRAATSGPPALALLEKESVDLVLLDINMPGMDGYEVCRRIKDHPAMRHIPVLFLSANTETEDIVKGFALGASDYITKPFEIAEVEARVATHLELRRLQRKLERQNEDLESIVRTRTAELREAHARLAGLDTTKNDFFRLISHELRTPLNGMAALEIALQEHILKDDPLKSEHRLFLQSYEHLIEIVDHALAIVEFQGEWEEPGDGFHQLDDLIRMAHEAAAPLAAERNVAWEAPLRSCGKGIHGVENHYNLALSELFKAAIRLADKGKPVELEFITPTVLCLWVNGPVLDAENLAGMFDVFGQRLATADFSDLGLGPCVAHRIFSYMGVVLLAEPVEPQGVRFLLDFRRAVELAAPAR